MPSALDLFCGAGGASIGLAEGGFDDILGMDIAPQPRYPWMFEREDVLNLSVNDVKGYDFIWASPPCQRWSTASGTFNPDRPDYIAATRLLLKHSGVPSVIENVITAPLWNPIMLCGTMFDLRVLRHRHFEFINCETPSAPVHPEHKGSVITGEFVTVAGHGPTHNTRKTRKARGLPAVIPGEFTLPNLRDAMGIPIVMTRKEIVEAVPPAYAKWVAHAILSR